MRQVRQFVGGIDANAHFASSSWPWVSDHGLEDQENVGARCFLTFLQKCDAFLPTTYDWMHTGDTSTWTSNANGQTARCDYFFLPLAWQQATISTYGVDTVDTGLAGEDHAALRICVLYICDKEKRDAGEL